MSRVAKHEWPKVPKESLYRVCDRCFFPFHKLPFLRIQSEDNGPLRRSSAVRMLKVTKETNGLIYWKNRTTSSPFFLEELSSIGCCGDGCCVVGLYSVGFLKMCDAHVLKTDFGAQVT